MPHLHMSGLHAVVTALYVIAILGALRLLALTFPDSIFAKAWLTLF